MPDGEVVVGKLSSVNSLEMRLVIDGQENLFKVRIFRCIRPEHFAV